MEMKLELVPIPALDIDRTKAFYVDRLGFTEDVDVRPTDSTRVVQLTPPASACSIVLGAGLPLIAMEPGSIRGLHLVVRNIDDARQALIANGVDVGEIDDQGGGVKYASFKDPEGNSWALQEMAWRSETWD
jgi:catechol 2,3-dioxygenase-like lactoylglutathione lyase family enzyme